MQQLKETAESEGWNFELEVEFNEIHVLHNTIRQECEQKMRKLRTGDIPCPCLQVFCDTIALWDSLNKKQLGCQVSHSTIQRALKKVDVGTENIFLLSNRQVKARLLSARQAYREAKKNA